MKCPEPIRIDWMIFKGDLARGANYATQVILTKLVENLEIVLAIYGEMTSSFEAPQKVLCAQGITRH